jgi:beta-lactamase superfamily II metal-dependent hydrolase
MRTLLCCTLPLLLASLLPAANTLEIYIIDTEGGKGIIVAPPGGETMLVDAGYPTADDRDTNRIVSAAQALGIKEFDYLVATHYDADHSGNVPKLITRIPARTFVDHGEIISTANERNRKDFYETYVKAIAGKSRMIVKPGDVLPLKGVKITVVTAGGAAPARPVSGVAGQPNALCGVAAIDKDVTDIYDNAGSVGLLYEYGKFRMLDLADLLQSVEYKLLCPTNLIGQVSLFMVSHHGFKISNSPLLYQSLQPRVAIMNNAARKGGEIETFDAIRSNKRLEDLWQMHESNAAKEKNVPEQFIANPATPCGAKMIRVSVQSDGTFTVTNTRNNFSKTYRP